MTPTDPLSNPPEDAAPESTTTPPTADTGLSPAPVAPETAEAANQEPKAPIAPIAAPDTDPVMPSVMHGQSMVVGGVSGETAYNLNGQKLGGSNVRRKMSWLVGSTLAIIVLAGGYAFGFYIPNKPENVWNSGIDRSGKAVNMLVDNATAAETVKKLTASEVQGNLTLNAGSISASSAFTASFDADSGNMSLSLDMPKLDENGNKTDGSNKLSLDAMGQLPVKAKFPDIYFRLSGISALGLDNLVPGISNFDNTWIYASSEYISQSMPVEGTKSSSGWNDVTAADVTTAIKAVTKTTTDYALTTDPSKNLIVQKSFSGKETVDGVQTYRYKAYLQKAHAKDYCRAVGETAAATSLYKKLVDSKDRTVQKDDWVKSCQQQVNNVKDGETFDLWVNRSTKLIHKIRIYDATDRKSYADIGQKYSGNDMLDLFSVMHDDMGQNDMKANVRLQLKDMSASGNISYENHDKANKYSFTADFSVTASDKKVEIKKPNVTVPLPDVLQKLGLNDMFGMPNMPGMPAATEQTATPTHSF